MDDEKEFQIKVHIEGRPLPLTVKRRDEHIYRDAEKLLNKHLQHYQTNFAKRPWEDTLIYAAYDLAVKLTKRDFEQDIAPLAEKIKKLDSEVAELLSEK